MSRGPNRLSGICTVCLSGGLAIALSGATAAQVHFDDVSAEKGIVDYTMMDGMGAGLVAADYDGDGDVDVFVPTAIGIPDQLYRNLGDGTFEEIAADVGLDSLLDHRASLWLDVDGDHDLDLVVAGQDQPTSCDLDCQTISLYIQNADGTFTDTTATSGLHIGNDFTQVSPMTAGDINNDGYLDLFVPLYGGRANLFLNDHDGTFTDISATSRVDFDITAWQPMMYDFNRDGWLDIYVNVDFTTNLLHLNMQNQSFVERAAQAGVANAMNDMGMAFGDYDNDGDIDIYTTNVYDLTGALEHNVLMRNDSVGGELAFVEIAEAAGVAQGHWGWGSTFLDCDNDGFLDIAATNGWFELAWADDPSVFYHNQGGPDYHFEDKSEEFGFADTDWGSGLIAFDYDRDGDLDMMQTCALGGPLRLLQNTLTAPAKNYLVVKPRMDGPNHYAIGAEVEITRGTRKVLRVITAGTSFYSQEPAEAFFGLASSPTIDAIKITWPGGGGSTTWTGVTVNRVLTLMPGGQPEDLDMDADVDFSDMLEVLAAWGPCPAECPEDLDGPSGEPDGSVGFSDLLRVLAAWDTPEA